MPQGLTYTDAVKLLGGSGPLMKITDNLLGGALTVATAGGSDAAISLFDAKTEVIRLGHLVTDKINDVVRGQGRYNRSERLHAAHAVLAVSSFFSSLDDCLRAAGLASPGFAKDDQLLLVAAAGSEGSWQSRLLDSPVPAPAPDLTADRLGGALLTWFASLATTLVRHMRGLAVWDTADDRAHRAVERLLTVSLPAMARAGYEEAARRLATDVPEFAIWMSQHEAAAVSRSLDTLAGAQATVSGGLRDLEATLLRVTSHRDPQRHRAALARVYRSELGEPVLGGATGDLTLTVPSLDDAYLDPRFRVRTGASGPRPADEAWWGETDVRADFGTFLATYLTTPQAATAPLLLLGQPGGGKSSLTRILAARLPPADYLVVRVPLREVRAEAGIQDQIEQALREAIGETVAWAELAGSADAAMPVILLDGLDELLQSTGLHQSDYLERVAEFQRREARLGRPAAVVVTSRVAVADRARIPAGGLVARLEPFAAAQVDRWLQIWNTANAGYWARTGRRPLTGETVMPFPELATQPLLLLMLALYDSGANALQDAGGLDAGELYERLLHDFAEREVRRVHGDRLPAEDLHDLVEEELLRLSVVAFAMFHRLRLWATTDELDADLTGLGLKPSGTARTEGFQRPFTAGEEMVGRFFFIQRTRAVQDDKALQTYEFLHATFGEYLVARLVVQAARQGEALSRVRTVRLGRQEDDDLLRSLLGYTPLCARNTVLPFITAMLSRSDTAELRTWVVSRLRDAVTRPAWTPQPYRPIDKRLDHWLATYSFNLLLIALACGGPVRATDLFQQARDPAGWLRDTVLQWRGAIPGSMWLDGLAAIQVRRTWADERRRDIVLEMTGSPVAEPVDPRWSHRFGSSWTVPGSKLIDDFSTNFPMVPVLTTMALSGAFSDDVFRHVTDPVLENLSWEAVSVFAVHGPDDAESIANSLVRLLLLDRCGDDADTAALVRAYDRAAHALERWESVAGQTRQSQRSRNIFLRALADDASRLPAGYVLGLATSFDEFYDDLVPLIVECLGRGWSRPDPDYDEIAGYWVNDLTRMAAQFPPEACLRALTALPVTDSWPLGEVLDVLAARFTHPDVPADADFAGRVRAAFARFEGYAALPG